MTPPFTTLITAAELNYYRPNPNWVIVDCRFSLADTEAGRAAYLAEHIPGARYAHLDEDLSGPPLTDRGRHPLPSPARIEAVLQRLGVSADSQLVVYDDSGGMLASRLWWLARYMGLTAVAVLDGGWSAWKGPGYPTAKGAESGLPGSFVGKAKRDWLLTLEQVEGVPLLIDARAPERYRGEEEPLDKQAGHIPGAVNHFYGKNLTDDGFFRPASELHEIYTSLLGEQEVEGTAVYCGSGVSACHNILAMVHAGFSPPKLYAGSWSEWSLDPARPIETR